MTAIKKSLIVTSTTIFALVALAGDTDDRDRGSRTVKLTEHAILLGASVPPGQYTVDWTRERGSDVVRLKLAHDGKTVAYGSGRWIESEQPSPYHALVYRPNVSGRNELSEIRFAESVDVIDVTPESAQANLRRTAHPESD